MKIETSSSVQKSCIIQEWYKSALEYNIKGEGGVGYTAGEFLRQKRALDASFKISLLHRLEET